MVMTTGQPEPSQWATGDLRDMFVRDAIAARGYRVYAGEDDPEPEAEPSGDEARAGVSRSPRSHASAMAAIADATGQDLDELDELDFVTARDIIDQDLSDPAAVFDAIAEADDRAGAPTYRAREAAFGADKGMSNRRRAGHVRPSRTPEARRQRHLQGLVDAGKYPDLATADAMTQRRGGNKRLGRSASESPSASTHP